MLQEMVNALREELVTKGNSLEEVKKAVKEVSASSTINFEECRKQLHFSIERIINKSPKNSYAFSSHIVFSP